MNYILRKIDLNNLDEINYVKRNSLILNSGEYDEFGDLKHEECDKYIEENFEKYKKVYRLIIHNDKIIGTLLIYEYEDGYLFDELYIEKKYRKLGIGKEIINDVITSYNKNIYLHCFKDNIIALELYKKLGFVTIEEHKTTEKLVRKEEKKVKVVVGMSGGVDSAVSALLLEKQGYEVIGLFMKNWDSNINNDIEGITDGICPQEQDYKDAKEVCDKLCIPLYRVDFIKEYWDNVFTYFLDELKKGRTPNPDVMCNKYIKFDAFIKEAKKLGAEKIATGHYARLNNNKLLRGKDNNKDQTYFLSALTPNQLKDVLFPVGELQKEEVRKIALENNLNVAKKKDSTGICFIGERNYQKFISNYLKPNSGDIINVETKEIIGRHNGLMNYTIGQRKNVGLSGDVQRHYVCGKDVEKNILYVAFGSDNKYLITDELIVENMNFISSTKPTFCTAKFRYRGEDVPVEIEYINSFKIKVKYKCGAKAVTPGQVCVLYLGEECLGGGIIEEVRKNGKKLWYL